MAFTPTDPNKAEVRITGTAPDYGLDFYIPRGERGEVGPTGPQGPAVPTNLSIGTIEVGPAAPGTVGPQGLTGPKGDPGGFVISSLLGTAHLDNITTPGLYWQNNGSNTTTANGYPVTQSVGMEMQVTALDSNAVVQEIQIASGSLSTQNVFWRRRKVTTWGAWRAYNSTRVDQTAGRVIYQWDDVNNREQLTYGDTGWRELVATPVTNGVVSGNLRYRRIGQRVTMRVVDVLMSTAITGACVLATATEVPVGFRPAANYRSQQNIGQSNNGADQQVISNYGEIAWIRQITNAGVSITRPPAALSGYIDWITEDVWPAALPGTAAGSIPNA